MDKRFKTTYLLDIYGSLLTQKQRGVMEKHLNDDYSVSEIALEENVSRQAACELIKRTEKILYDYDEKLGLFDRYLKNSEIAREIELACEGNEKVKRLIAELKENL